MNDRLSDDGDGNPLAGLAVCIGFYGLIALLIMLTILAVGMSGCATGFTPEGREVVGIDTGQALVMAEEGADALPFPLDLVAGLGLAGLSAYAAHARARRVGERAGWDEAVAAKTA